MSIWMQISACFDGFFVSGRFRTRRRSVLCENVISDVQILEPRIVLTAVTAYDEYFLALINRARQDPVAEAARLGINLNEGLPAGTLAPGPRQPLALNDFLQSAIDGHLADELAKNYFSHTGSDNSTPQKRIEAAGYTGWTTIGENLGIQYSTGAVNVTQYVLDEYNALFIDTTAAGRGHRINILNGNFKEVGSSVGVGTFQGANAVHTGNDFGARPGNSFLTGIVYTDTVNANRFYDVGEGIGNASVVVVGGGNTYRTTTNTAGGYQIALPAGNFTVTFSGTGISTPIVKSFAISNLNVEVDANTRTDINNPVQVSGLSSILTYVTKTPAITIAPSLVITQPDGLSITGATITFANWQDGDQLEFNNSFALEHTFTQNLVTKTATLSILGSDTAAHYQTTLRSFVFWDVAGNPVTWLRRAATFTVTDAASNSASGTQTIVVNTVANSSPPVVSGVSGPLTYVKGTAPITVVPNLVVIQPNGVNLYSTTIAFANWQDGDQLQFFNTFALEHTFTQDLIGHTAVLTITGFDTAAHYQTTLRSMQFWDVAGNPVTWLKRVATITVTDINSNTASATQNLAVNLVANSSPPTVSGLTGTVTYVKSAAPISIFSNLVVAQPNGLNLYSVTISFTNWQDGDQLQFLNTFALEHTFVQDLVSHTASLKIIGFDTASHYQTTLRSIQFWAAAGNLNTSLRVATITVTDLNSNVGSGIQNVAVSN